MHGLGRCRRKLTVDSIQTRGFDQTQGGAAKVISVRGIARHNGKYVRRWPATYGQDNLQMRILLLEMHQ